QSHSAGPVSGDIAGGGFLCVHPQPEKTDVSVAVDGGLDAVRFALLGSGAGAMGAGLVIADGIGSVALRDGRRVFLFGRAIICAAQTVESSRRRSRSDARSLVGSQRFASSCGFRGGSVGSVDRSRRRDLLAGEPA